MTSSSLSERFLAPPGWRTHSFLNPDTGHTLFYGSVYPADKPPGAIIVCVGGLSEFSEKYYEVAHDMLDRGFAFWFMDWAYQGRSSRLEKFPQRRHTDGFEKDASDLTRFVIDYVKPAAVHPDRGRIPLILLGHSMGANISLRLLAEHPRLFDAAAFTAPLLGIYNFTWPLKMLAAILTPFMPVIGKNYVFGGSDWKESMRASNGKDKFSTDPARDALHNHWSLQDTTLQIGNPTFLWVVEALKSCAFLKKPGILESIDIPILIGLAGNDKIIDNNDIRNHAGRLPREYFIEIPKAEHEILMECDECRNMFLKAFDKMVEENKIATMENLKSF